MFIKSHLIAISFINLRPKIAGHRQQQVNTNHKQHFATPHTHLIQTFHKEIPTVRALKNQIGAINWRQLAYHFVARAKSQAKVPRVQTPPISHPSFLCTSSDNRRNERVPTFNEPIKEILSL